MLRNIVVVGLGYVGLPLALLADRKGYSVTGLDISKERVSLLKSSKSPITDVDDKELSNSSVKFSTNPSVIKQADAVIVCVPTPVTKNKEPDLRPIRGAFEAISPFLQSKTLVVLESTVNPGVCDEIVVPLIESITKHKIGKDIYLAYCPERINPGDTKWNVSNISRVIGANTKTELTIAKELYESLIDAEIKPMASLKEAEAVKVVENSFRDINIAFVNELAMSFHKLGINIENVIDGASTKPFSFMAHHPGCGVGGHCIPVDPYYLIEYASSYGFNHEFLRLARKINDGMPAYTVDLLEEALNEIAKSLKGTKVTLLGLSFKANVGDDRESPSYDILNILKQRGVKITTYDPYLFSGTNSAKTLQAALIEADAIIIATAHKEFAESLTLKSLKQSEVKVVIDGRNLLREIKQSLIDNSIVYRGIGL